MERNIQIVHLPDIDAIQKSRIDSALSGCYDKLQRIASNELLLKAHFKQHESDGKRTKYSVHLHLLLPGIGAVASETGWNLLNVLQDAVAKLERESIKKLKS